MTDSDLIIARLNAARLGRGERIEYFRGSLVTVCDDMNGAKDVRDTARKVRRAAQEAAAAGRVLLAQRRVPEGFQYLACGTGK
jgi:hypothetical protein